ncbi:MAG: SpoIIE family protein phosphatase [Vicinamibacterales bacterium]
MTVAEVIDVRPRTALPLPPATILVVDDGPVNLQVLVRTLHGSGHRVLVARDGRAALDIVRRARPDLVLLDVMMPDIDGFEVCRAIKADPATEETVVIFLSALDDVADKVSGLKLGAADYITKPIQSDEVLARIETHLTRQYLERELRRNRDRLDRELESAADMQRQILPQTLPTCAAVDFAAYYRTSRHAGGDYYDVLDLGSGRYGVLVADVSGHGAPAAIVMAMLRTAVHGLAQRDDPAAVLGQINEHFRYLWGGGMFATAFYAVLDVPNRTLRASCAGHPPPLLVRQSARGAVLVPLPVDAVRPLLLMDLGDVPVSEYALEPEDRILLYTDGITDRDSSDGSMFDETRLVSALARAAALEPGAMVNQLVADLDAFADGQEPHDDQTLLLVRIKGTAVRPAC